MVEFLHSMMVQNQVGALGEDSKQLKCLICGAILDEVPDEWTSVNCEQCNTAFRLDSAGNLVEVEDSAVIATDPASFLGSTDFESFDVDNLLAEEEARKQRKLEEEQRKLEEEKARLAEEAAHAKAIKQAKRKQAELARAKAKAEKKKKKKVVEVPEVELPGLALEPVNQDLDKVAGELEALSFDQLSDPQKKAFRLETTAESAGDRLNIEGLNKEKSNEREFGIKCPVCDTRVYAKVSQVGERIECPDCYTKIKVPEAPKIKEEWSEFAAKLNDQDPDEELRLSEPEEFTAADLDGLGLDPVVEDLLASASPNNPPPASDARIASERSASTNSVGEPKPNIAADEGQINDDPGVEPVEVEQLEIEPITLEPAKPTNVVAPDGIAPPNTQTPTDKQQQAPSPWGPKPSERNKRKANPESENKSKSEAKPKKSTGKKSRRNLLESESAGEADGIFDSGEAEIDMSPFTAESLYSRAMTSVFTPGVLMRGAIAVVLLTFSAMFFAWGEGFRGMTDRGVSGWMSMLGNYVAFLVMWIAGTIGVLRVSSMLFRELAIGKKKVSRWSISGFEDAKSTFMLFAFSYVVACSPFWGFWILTSVPIGSGVAFLIAPVLLLGAWYNRSPFMILAIDAFDDIRSNLSDWKWFFIFMLLLAVVNIFGGLFYWVGFLPLFFMAALIQTSTTFVFASLTGWHVGRVVHRLEDAV